MTTGFELNLLGPVTVRVDDHEVLTTAVRARALLALLALDANAPVGVPRLLERLWAGRRPPTALASLRNTVSHLRKDLGTGSGAEVETTEHGYRLKVDRDAVDLLVFTDAVERGRAALRALRHDDAAALLEKALGRWRGAALCDLAHAGFDWPERRVLGESRLAALELRLEADLRRGRHREVAAELEYLVQEHPGRETFHRLYVDAAGRSGRRQRATEAYVHARAVLREIHGREPGVALESAHLRLLTARPARSTEVGDPATRSQPARPDIRRPVRPVVALRPLAPGVDEGCALRRVVVVCVRVAAGARAVRPWPLVVEQVEAFGGWCEEPRSDTLTAFFGLDEPRHDDATRAVLAVLSVRGKVEAAGVVMTGTVVCAPRVGTDTVAVDGRVVGQCLERVATLPLGTVWCT